jgi:hemerythrin-like domain-containing protein
MKLSANPTMVDLSVQSMNRLRRDDYNGLLIVSKIRRAIRYEIDSTLIARLIKIEFDLHLDAHFTEEETCLFTRLPHNDALRKQAQRQHDHLKYLAWLCSSEKAIPASVAEEFANKLEEHIRFEERTFFPYLRDFSTQQYAKSKSPAHRDFTIN